MISRIGCQAQENCMTTNYVPFGGTMWIKGAPSTTPMTKDGYLIIENDNQSRNPATLKRHKVPVRF